MTLLRFLIFCVSLIAFSSCSSPYHRTIDKIYDDAKKDRGAFAVNFGSDIDLQSLSILQERLQREQKPKYEQDGPRCVRAYWGETLISGSVFFYFEPNSLEVVESFESDGGFRQSIGNVTRHNPRDGVSPSGACIESNNAK